MRVALEGAVLLARKLVVVVHVELGESSVQLFCVLALVTRDEAVVVLVELVEPAVAAGAGGGGLFGTRVVGCRRRHRNREDSGCRQRNQCPDHSVLRRIKLANGYPQSACRRGTIAAFATLEEGSMGKVLLAAISLLSFGAAWAQHGS